MEKQAVHVMIEVFRLDAGRQHLYHSEFGNDIASGLQSSESFGYGFPYCLGR